MFVTEALAEETTTAPAAAGTAGEAGHTPAAAGEAVHTETGVPGGGGHETGVFPPFDSTSFPSQLLWLAITFGLFYLLMARVALPRLGAIIETRKNRIDQDLDEARRLKDEADHASAAYELELAEAKKRAHGIGQKARDEAKALAESERHRVEADLNAKLASAEDRISGIKASAMKEVDKIASDTTAVILRELLGMEATAAEIGSAIAGKR
jgi:F-type H+-transporting ATPase subunit b